VISETPAETRIKFDIFDNFTCVIFYPPIESQAAAVGLIQRLACKRALFLRQSTNCRLSTFLFFPARVALPLQLTVEHRELDRM
jgi:hypothetical protein